MTASSRRDPRALPGGSSDLPPPDISAVSKWVTPASRAARATAMEASPSSFMPKLLQPSPISESDKPLVPTVRVSMGRTYRFTSGSSPPGRSSAELLAQHLAHLGAGQAVHPLESDGDLVGHEVLTAEGD